MRVHAVRVQRHALLLQALRQGHLQQVAAGMAASQARRSASTRSARRNQAPRCTSRPSSAETTSQATSASQRAARRAADRSGAPSSRPAKVDAEAARSAAAPAVRSRWNSGTSVPSPVSAARSCSRSRALPRCAELRGPAPPHRRQAARRAVRRWRAAGSACRAAARSPVPGHGAGGPPGPARGPEAAACGRFLPCVPPTAARQPMRRTHRARCGSNGGGCGCMAACVRREIDASRPRVHSLPATRRFSCAAAAPWSARPGSARGGAAGGRPARRPASPRPPARRGCRRRGRGGPWW